MRPRTTRPPGTPQLAFTIPEAAAALALGINSVRALITEGRLSAIKVRNRLIIPASAVDRFLNQEAERPA